MGWCGYRDDNKRLREFKPRWITMGFDVETTGYVTEKLFLYSACDFFQLGISLVYWLNIFKTHCVLIL